MLKHEDRFPETISKNSAQWATLCYDRSPEFKVHSGKGLASSAIANKKPYTEIALYENQNGVWIKVWEYVFPEICRCGQTYDEAAAKGDRYRRCKYNIDPEFEGSVKDAPVICSLCYKAAKARQHSAKQEERERRQLAELKAKYDQPITACIGGLENLISKD